MDDETLAKAMNISLAEVAEMTPGMRAAAERQLQIGGEANLYKAGLADGGDHE